MAKTGISKNATAKMKKIAGKKELKEDKVRVTEKNATMLNSRILKDTVNRLKRCCVEKETTIQEFLNRIILERLEEEGF